MSAEKKIYFASDFHLGVPNYKDSLEREKKVVRWLNQILPTCKELYLMGDVFDFWFEWKHVVPKYYVRLLGKLAEFHDAGIPITFFTGNHDMWVFGYLEKEIGAKIIRKPITKEFNEVKFYLAHGDGLGPGDYSYKVLKFFFTNKFCQWLLARAHPNITLKLGYIWCKNSRCKHGEEEKVFLGEDKEFLILYANEVLKKEHFDYFIFVHRHLPKTLPLSDKSTYVNLGDWITDFTYAEFDGKKIALKTFEG